MYKTRQAKLPVTIFRFNFIGYTYISDLSAIVVKSRINKQTSVSANNLYFCCE